MAYAYAVEYLRNGMPDKFITFDQHSANEFAIRRGGIIYELGKICQSDSSKPSVPSYMTSEAACSLPQTTAT